MRRLRFTSGLILGLLLGVLAGTVILTAAAWLLALM